MRRLFTAALLLLLVVPVASAQSGKGDRTARDAKRARIVQDFRNTARGAQTLSSPRAVTRAAGDFNDDGTRDVVVAVPGEDANLGAVHIFYGGANGLRTNNDQLIRQSDWCGGAASTAGSGFAQAIAVADFNGDGASDLAVSSPNYDFFGTNTGVVFLFYGNPGGAVTPFDDCQYVEETDTIGGASDGREDNDRFGATLAAGNFGGSGHADLAVGIPDEDVGAQGDAGAVATVYGSANGLTFEFLSGSDGQPRNTTTPPQFFNQTNSLEGVSETGDSFGDALDAGNLGRTSHADLAVGVPGEDIAETNGAGAVNVIYGSGDGLSSLHDQIWTQDSDGVKDTAEEGEGFGSALAIGNFGKSGAGDLAIGAFLEDGSRAFVVGAVNVLYGSSSGLTANGSQIWSQDSSGVPDAGEVLDFWGFSLAAGNVGKSGEADLIVGAPLETPGSTDFDDFCPGPIGCAGQITVLYGSNGGLRGQGAKIFNQDSAGVPNAAEAGDEFGFSVASGNYGEGSPSDVVVGSPFEDIGATNSAGGINVLFGSRTGLTGAGAQFFSQDSSGVEDTAEAGDSFGNGLG